MALLYAYLYVTAWCLLGISADWTKLSVKYSLTDGFFGIPLSLGEVKKDSPPKYVYVEHDKSLNVDLYSYPNDPRFFVLFDSHGNIAGLRTGYHKKDVANRATFKNKTFLYDYDRQPFYTSGNYWDTPLWYTTVLFLSPDTLKAGGRKDTGGLVAEDIYLPLEGKWTLIPKDQCKAEGLGFTKQACFMGMGMHYFYKMRNTTDCKDLQGVFLLFESGQLIGLGLSPFGSFTAKDRVWFEDHPTSFVKNIVPRHPDCLVEWFSNYGTTSMHIFFKRFPKLTKCNSPWQKEDQCPK